MLINNKRESNTKKFEVINPYTNEIVGINSIASEKQINMALELSYDYKCELSGAEKSDILRRTAEAIKNIKDEIAALITSESGLCINNSQHEVQRAIDCLNYAVLEAKLIDEKDLSSEFILNPDPSMPKLNVIAEPMDLAIGITPFNHPLNLVVHKVAPAIVAGTAMVLKPSEKTPLTALKFGELLVKSGLPANHLNIVNGIPPQMIVDQLITHPKIDLVSITGGVETGRYIENKMVNSGNYFKKYMPELGGNATFVVMDDCDLELACNIAMASFENSGQRCTAIRRILLHENISKPFLDQYIEKTSKLVVGDPMDPNTDIGTVIDEQQVDEIQSRIFKAVNEGARILFGNKRNGALLSPTIIDNVNPKCEIAADETFGPVVSIISIRDLGQAIDIIKNDKYGLASAIATSNKKNAMRLFNNICVGQFSWNGPPGYRTEAAPFGGYGVSGNGEKEGIIMMVRALRRIRTFYHH